MSLTHRLIRTSLAVLAYNLTLANIRENKGCKRTAALSPLYYYLPTQ